MAEQKEIRLDKRGRKRPAKYKSKPLSAKVESFIRLLAEGFNQAAAARILHIPAGSISCFLTLAAKDRLAEVRKMREDSLTISRAEQALAHIDLVDTELAEMAVHGEGKKPGRLRACSLKLQRYGLIDAPGAKVTAQAAAGVVAQGGTAYEVYQSKWLRDRDAKWNQQLESQHVLPPAPAQ